MRRIALDGWEFLLPDGAVGGELRHRHAHVSVMAQYRSGELPDLEVIFTTFPGRPLGEHGQPLDGGGLPTRVPGASGAIRRDQVTQLDDDPDIPPVKSILIVATGPGGSVCLVVHRPLHASAGPSEAIAGSLARVPT